MDFDRIAMLLHVANECKPSIHPRLKPIFDRAMEELQTHADGTADPQTVEEPVEEPVVDEPVDATEEEPANAA